MIVAGLIRKLPLYLIVPGRRFALDLERHVNPDRPFVNGKGSIREGKLLRLTLRVSNVVHRHLLAWLQFDFRGNQIIEARMMVIDVVAGEDLRPPPPP